MLSGPILGGNSNQRKKAPHTILEVAFRKVNIPAQCATHLLEDGYDILTVQERVHDHDLPPACSTSPAWSSAVPWIINRRRGEAVRLSEFG